MDELRAEERESRRAEQARLKEERAAYCETHDCGPSTGQKVLQGLFETLDGLGRGLQGSSSSSEGETAFFTGKMEYVTTVTSKSGVNCQYNYAGQTFWRVFADGQCPSSVEVQ